MNILQKIAVAVGSVALLGCIDKSLDYSEAQEALRTRGPAPSPYCVRFRDSLDETNVRLDAPVSFFDYLLRSHGIHVVGSKVRSAGPVEGLVETNDGSRYYLVMNSFQRIHNNGIMCGQGIIHEWSGQITKISGPGPKGTAFLEQLVGTRCDAYNPKKHWEKRDGELQCTPGDGKLILKEWE